MKKTHILFLSIAILTSSLSFAETLKLAVSTASQKLIGKVKPALKQKEKVDLEYNSENLSGSETFMRLVQGKVDGAVVGLSTGDLEKLLQKENRGVTDFGKYHSSLVGNALVKFFAHKSINVSAIDENQMRDILLGKITNWKDVGGADLPIQIFYSKDFTGSLKIIEERILNKQVIMPKPEQTVESSKALKEKVATTPGAFGWGIPELIDATVAEVKTPEIGRPIIVYTKGLPTNAMIKFLKYTKAESNMK